MFSWLAKIVKSPAKKISIEEMEAPKADYVPTWYENFQKDLETFDPLQRCNSCANLCKHKETDQNVYEIGICIYYGLPCSANSHCFSKHYRKGENVILENSAQTSLALLDDNTSTSGSENIEQ